jgi:hypothetical protein
MNGLVIEVHTELCSVDVKLSNGIVQHSIPIISREWAGDINPSAAVGERDMPPKGALVAVLFFNKARTEAMVIGSALAPFSQKVAPAQRTLLTSGQERKYMRVMEAGWTIVRDKNTGATTISNSTGSLNGFSFAIDASGNVAVQLPAGKTLSFNGSSKTFVTTADLQSAINGLITALKAHTHAVVGGTATASPDLTTLSMTVPATTTVKTGG